MQSRFQTRRRKLRSSQIFPRKHSDVLGNIDPVPEETRSGILPACRCLGAIYLVRTKLSMGVVRRRNFPFRKQAMPLLTVDAFYNGRYLSLKQSMPLSMVDAITLDQIV